MEPIPETLEAIDELDARLDDGTLLGELQHAADLAQGIAPDLAGVSVATAERGGVTFTLIATDEEIAALDGMQYLTAGPCVQVAQDGRGMVTTSADLFGEDRWRAFGQAAAAAGVRSTLTFPIVHGDHVTGTVDLYGRSDDAFQGKHQALADVFRAWAPGAVTNADLSFSTRRLAEQAPGQIRDDALLETATGILSAMYELTSHVALEQIEEAAMRAGVSVTRIARAVVSLHDTGPD